MVTGGAHLEDGDRRPSSATRGGGATTGSWVSGQSVSTSGSVGSPSSRSEHAMATPASDNAFLRLNHLDIHADDAVTQDAAANKKKKRGQRAAGGADKSGRGLRQFSMKGICIQSFSNMPPFLQPEKSSALVYACLLKDRIPCYTRVDFMILLFYFSPVCEKVESKGTTTYNEHCKYPLHQDVLMLHMEHWLLFLFCFDKQLAYICSALVSSTTEVGKGISLLRLVGSLGLKIGGNTTRDSMVADELVAEFADPTNSVSTPDQQQYDEKNIRRRVYDALNVLMALDIISKDKKEIQWKGLPRTSLSDIEDLKAERLGLRNRIEKKAAYLQELEEHVRIANTHMFVGLQNLIQRNEQLYSSGNAPSGGVSLPFILVQTRPHATVEVEISEDMQLVHFDFNSTPFELHDDNYVLKAMKFCERPQSNIMAPNPAAGGGEGASMSIMYQPQIRSSPLTNNPVRPPTSPPLPGIIKARVKHEP
ncbi:hypothetical protein DKX38_024199 [Salix brachista]|uniref:E2F/DP family winged-helix DNA-binding domain-containing protein n=1 Tax=Salix brachista TaxID=2182728 RepID=A0A5N5JR21_9ROSI|nr:hypothetical protein DKX38_024199 [Salix brachista]